MNTNDNSNFFWYLFISVSGVAGIINIKRVLGKAKDVVDLEEIIKKQTELIALKDETIDSLKSTITELKQVIENGK